MSTTGKKYHWERKNPQSREAYLQANHDQNSIRPKQVFQSTGAGGFWVRG